VKQEVYSVRTLIPALLLLAVISGALAMWYDTLKINATIETGYVKVKFSSWGCSDTGPDPQAEGYHNTEGKDVSACSVTVEREDEGGNPVKLLVTINNAYPGYSVEVEFTVDNIGTIPVKLYGYELSGVDESALSVSLVTPDDTQIDAGEESGTYKLIITVLQTAGESSTYTFELTLNFAQWNEVQ
jgi:predicted ribosomally synthesized peptide with SipW-like signal peptide